MPPLTSLPPLKLLLPGLLTATLALGLLAAGATGQEAPGPATSWIDAPLPGTTVPLAPVEIVGHAAHVAGVGDVALFVDDVQVDLHAAGDVRSTLTTVRFRWMPPGPGYYRLEIRARPGSDGPWGEPARTLILVVPTASPAPSPTPSPSGWGSPSPGPTLTPRPTPSPTPSTRATPTPSPIPTLTPRPTPSPTPRPTPSPTPIPTPTPAPTPTPSPSTRATPTPTPSPTR